MKTAVSVAALGAIAGLATGQTVIEFNNVVVDAANPITFTIMQTDAGPLEGFSWDLVYETIDPSWGGELNIVLTHIASGYSINFDGTDGNLGDTMASDVLFGWGKSSGVFSSAGSVAVTGGPSDTIGAWRVEIFEDFDDFGDDGILNGTITINKVPAPSALALLGMGGLVAGRRRR